MATTKADKIYTTTYDNFKGVDYTNDITNVYKRRTPSGINMIPNLDGVPRKRTGWNVELRNSLFGTDANILSTDYFELNGCDHIAIFTNVGLFMYRYTGEDETPDELVLISTIETVKYGYDCTFFFEANGISAYYVYGDYKVWRYRWTDGTETDADGETISKGYLFEECTPYVPRIRISTLADGSSGTTLEGYNMLGDMVAEEFQNNCIPKVISSTYPSSVATFYSDTFLSVVSTKGSYTYSYSSSNDEWTDSKGYTVDVVSLGLVLNDGASYTDMATLTVNVGYTLRTYLATNVSQSDVGRVKVFVADPSAGALTNQLACTTSAVSSTNPCRLIDYSGKTCIEYYAEHTPLVDGEDAIRVEYPNVSITKTTHNGSATVSAKIGGDE